MNLECVECRSGWVLNHLITWIRRSVVFFFVSLGFLSSFFPYVLIDNLALLHVLPLELFYLFLKHQWDSLPDLVILRALSHRTTLRWSP